MMPPRHFKGIVLLALVASCSAAPIPDAGGTRARMDFTRPDFFAAPFPSEDLRGDAGLRLAAFPNPDGIDLVTHAIDLLTRDARGFATSGGVFFAMTGGIDPASLPPLAGSTALDAGMVLLSIDPAAPDFLQHYPFEAAFETDAGPFGAPNLLSMIPLQGIPLRPGTLYAAILRARLRDASGAALRVSDAVAALSNGQHLSGLSGGALEAYQLAMGAAAEAHIDDVAALAVFRTGDPTATFAQFRASALMMPPPIAAPFVAKETFRDFCVFASTIPMPDWQSGTPPFETDGGGWQFDAGAPLLQRFETARLVVTIPRSAMPDAGFPVVVLVRTGAGGDRPLVDRGPQAFTGGPPIAPGTGPALHFADAGWAGISVDGPLGGARNPTGGDEQFLIFNLFNGEALRDNVRESALELDVLAHALDGITFDAGGCGPTANQQVRFDVSHVALMGHSMGATIAPLALAFEPRFRALILSGGGGSWIENIIWKKDPLAVRPIVEQFIGYRDSGRVLTGHDPVLTLLQWAIEPADPQVYARWAIDETVAPRHVLMLQGIVDHYILPRIANALSLALGLDLGGTPLDERTPELADEPPLSGLLHFAGRGRVDLPVRGNRFDGGITAVVVQHPSDGIEDGHEVAFQTPEPKHEYRCFLRGIARNTAPTVVAPDAGCAP